MTARRRAVWQSDRSAVRWPVPIARFRAPPGTERKPHMIRTKIVATMGPATADPQVLRRLFEAGVDVCRLNFSHGDLAGHAKMLDTIRQAAADCEHPIAVLGDLC